MSFESLKKQSSLGSLTSKLVKEVEKMNGGDKGDVRFDVKYDIIDDGGIGGTRITNSGLDDP